MEPVYMTICLPETGEHIKRLLYKNGISVRDLQNAMGFENPQAIYKWLSGKTLPSIDNFLILSELVHTSINDILVVDGDFFYGKLIFSYILLCPKFSSSNRVSY